VTPTIRYTLAIGHSVAGFHQWNDATVEAAIAASWPFPGYTLAPARGRWEGAEQDSTLVTYLGSEAEEGAIIAAAEDIALALDQDSVLVTAEPVKVAFVSRRSAERREVA
jgi:hypothetical protein